MNNFSFLPWFQKYFLHALKAVLKFESYGLNLNELSNIILGKGNDMVSRIIFWIKRRGNKKKRKKENSVIASLT